MRDTLVFVDVEQGTPEWLALRSGVLTCSDFDKIVTPKRLEPSSQLATYIASKAAEAYMGHVADEYQSSHMAWGVLYENEARAYYQMVTGRETTRPGFIFLDDERLVGGSPDAFMPDLDTGVEIKCPTPEVHTRYLLNGVMPAEYICQVQGLMWVTGCTTWDFMSYHPELPAFLITVPRDDAFHAAMDAIMPEAINGLRTAVCRLKELN